MENNYKLLTFGFLIAVLASMTFMSGSGIKMALGQGTSGGSNTTSPSSSSMSGMNMSSTSPSSSSSSSGATTNKSTVTRDSITVLLEGKTIPAKGFIHLYDSTPYMINAGHVALHVPCDANSKPVVDLLIGSAPNFTKVQLDIVQGGLSQPGKMCLYHADIKSDPAKKLYQTDVAIQNPSDKTIMFPATSTVVVGLNEVQPGVPGG